MMSNQAPELEIQDVFPPVASPTDVWKPLLKAVRANSLPELQRRVNAMSYPENVCSIHFPLKVVPDPEHDELPCTEWFAFKPSDPGRQQQTAAFMPLLFAAVHNVYRWGEGYGLDDAKSSLAAQSVMSLELLSFVLRHGGDPHSSCFLGLELNVRDVEIMAEGDRSTIPRGEAGRRAWLAAKRNVLQRFFQGKRLSPLRRHLRITSGEYAGRFLFEAYGDLAADDELEWDAELACGGVLRITAVVADWHFAPVVACDVESKENYLYIPIGGQRAPLDYAVMLKEYAGRMRWSRTCAAVDEVLRRFHAWVGNIRVPQMVLVPSSMQKLLLDLYHDKSTSDVMLEAEGRRLHAHRLVLSAASPYFQVLLNGPFREGTERCIAMKCEYEVLDATLKFIYTGQQDDLIQADPLRVLPVAHHYGLDHLQHACELNAKADLHLGSLGACLRAGQAHGAGLLRRACFDFAARNPARCMLRPEVHTLREEDPELWQQLIAALGIHDAAVLASATTAPEAFETVQFSDLATDDPPPRPEVEPPRRVPGQYPRLRSEAINSIVALRPLSRGGPTLRSASSSLPLVGREGDAKLAAPERGSSAPMSLPADASRRGSGCKPEPGSSMAKRVLEGAGEPEEAEGPPRKRPRPPMPSTLSVSAMEAAAPEERVADCAIM